jgi:hypothetical protein
MKGRIGAILRASILQETGGFPNIGAWIQNRTGAQAGVWARLSSVYWRTMRALFAPAMQRSDPRQHPRYFGSGSTNSFNTLVFYRDGILWLPKSVFLATHF